MKIAVISMRGEIGGGGLAAEFDDSGGSIGRAQFSVCARHSLVLDGDERQGVGRDRGTSRGVSDSGISDLISRTRKGLLSFPSLPVLEEWSSDVGGVSSPSA